MVRMQRAKWLPFGLCLILMLSACYHPPYNNFKPWHRGPKDAVTGAAVGAVVGGFLGSTAASAAIGAGAGAAVFAGVGLLKESKKSLIRDLQRNGDIRFEQYGDTVTLIMPTDRYFYFNSSRFIDLCYHSLVRIVKLLKYYPCRVIYVAGFTDNVGSRYHKNMLSQAQAETMVTFLWANGIPAKLLNAEGYGDLHPVSDNRLIHGSAQNRRLEIQWYISPNTPCSPMCCKVDVAPVLPPTK
jgi:outer membrane protein OmpA-like peptidoglycan-associated protein